MKELLSIQESKKVTVKNLELPDAPNYTLYALLSTKKDIIIRLQDQFNVIIKYNKHRIMVKGEQIDDAFTSICKFAYELIENFEEYPRVISLEY